MLKFLTSFLVVILLAQASMAAANTSITISDPRNVSYKNSIYKDISEKPANYIKTLLTSFGCKNIDIHKVNKSDNTMEFQGTAECDEGYAVLYIIDSKGDKIWSAINGIVRVFQLVNEQRTSVFNETLSLF